MALDSSLGTIDYQSYKDLGNSQTAKQIYDTGLHAGEDLVNDVQKVEERFNYTNITTAATTVVKSGAGFLHSITVNTDAAGTITIYDNTAGSGTKIGTIKSSAGVNSYFYDVSFATGLTIVTAAANDLTIAYR